jgi:hypothetical protein
VWLISLFLPVTWRDCADLSREFVSLFARESLTCQPDGLTVRAKNLLRDMCTKYAPRDGCHPVSRDNIVCIQRDSIMFS